MCRHLYVHMCVYIYTYIYIHVYIYRYKHRACDFRACQKMVDPSVLGNFDMWV